MAAPRELIHLLHLVLALLVLVLEDSRPVLTRWIAGGTRGADDGRAIRVDLAPLERIEAPRLQLSQLCDHRLEWTYDDHLKQSKQVMMSRETPVPIVFAFTRRSLSRSLKRSAKTSCVAVLSPSCAAA